MLTGEAEMAEQYSIELSDRSALLIQGKCVYGVNKISINELYKSKEGKWKYGRKNITIPLEKELLKQLLSAIIKVSEADPETFERFDAPQGKHKTDAEEEE